MFTARYGLGSLNQTDIFSSQMLRYSTVYYYHRTLHRLHSATLCCMFLEIPAFNEGNYDFTSTQEEYKRNILHLTASISFEICSFQLIYDDGKNKSVELKQYMNLENIYRWSSNKFSMCYNNAHIVRMIKSRRMRWARHVARMGEDRGVYRLLVGKPEGRRPMGKPRRR